MSSSKINQYDVDETIAKQEEVDGLKSEFTELNSKVEGGLYNTFPDGTSNTNTMAEIFDACDVGVTMLPPSYSCSAYSPTGKNGNWQIIVFKTNGIENQKRYRNAQAMDDVGNIYTYNRAEDKWVVSNGMKLLWENASPTSTFEPQRISFDLSDYTCILVHHLYKSDDHCKQAEVVPVGHSIYLKQYFNYAVYRKIGTYLDRVEFDYGKKYTTYGASTATTDNTYMIPYQIYGIK